MPSMKRPSSSTEAGPIKKAKKVASTGFTAQSSKALPLDATIKRTEVTSSSGHLNKRSDQCDGLSVRQCLELKYRNAKGESVPYTRSDLRYDLQH
ncbi:unnamed protein product, partial [Symbiodinium sp. CCMP2456]